MMSEKEETNREKQKEICRALERIEDMTDECENIGNTILRSAGWEHTCQTPGSLWLWKKDGFLVDKGTAMHICEVECAESMAGPDPGN